MHPRFLAISGSINCIIPSALVLSYCVEIPYSSIRITLESHHKQYFYSNHDTMSCLSLQPELGKIVLKIVGITCSLISFQIHLSLMNELKKNYIKSTNHAKQKII